MKKALYIMITTALFTACSQDDTFFQENERVKMEEPSVIDGSIVSKTGAVKAARTFMRKVKSTDVDTRYEDSFDVDTVFTMYDVDDRTPLIYIINWEGNEGYTIMSSSEKTTPVLAFSEEGSFDIMDMKGAEIYIDMYKNLVRDSKDDSLEVAERTEHLLEWTALKSGILMETRYSSSNPVIQAEIDRKESLGYTCIGTISSLQQYLTTSEYTTLYNNLHQVANTNYDFDEYALAFVGLQWTPNHHLMNTTWHQGSPFNVGTSNGYAGCVPIAVAQIVNYHKYPNIYNWSGIYPLSENNSDFVYFMTDIRQRCNAVEEEEGTSASLYDAYNAMVGLGYSVTLGGAPSFESMRNQIMLGQPVLMGGYPYNSIESLGHAWVCEGYHPSAQYVASVSFPFYGPKFYKESEFFIEYNSTVSYTSSHFFYMNFGDTSGVNGWFTYNCQNPSTGQNFFQYYQYTIFISKP